MRAPDEHPSEWDKIRAEFISGQLKTRDEKIEACKEEKEELIQEIINLHNRAKMLEEAADYHISRAKRMILFVSIFLATIIGCVGFAIAYLALFR